MVHFLASKGVKVTCEPNQLGLVIFRHDGSVEAKCENVPERLQPFPTPKGKFDRPKLEDAHKNWILSVIFGTHREQFEKLTFLHDRLIKNNGGKAIDAKTGERIEVIISLPVEPLDAV